MSLINDALKRASEAQVQAAQRPRGPKGIEDLPAPMTPAASRERPAWLLPAGIGLLVVALLAASGFFFAKWWKERKAWQPYATEDIDEQGFPRTNQVAKVEPPKPAPASKAVTPPVPAATNPPTATNTSVTVTPPTPPVEPPKTNAPAVAAATNPPPATNLVAAVDPVPKPPVPPVVSPPMTKVETNQASVTPPAVTPTPPVTPPAMAKKDDEHPAKPAAIEFPELKLQGISRRKNKAFAILNGKTLTAGDRIDGVMLLKIDTDSVTVEKGGTRRELFLLR